MAGGKEDQGLPAPPPPLETPEPVLTCRRASPAQVTDNVGRRVRSCTGKKAAPDVERLPAAPTYVRKRTKLCHNQKEETT